MYNLLITSENGAWDGTSYEYEVGRFLEYTDDEFREQFARLDKDAIKILCAIPTLFMYEKPVGLPGRIGRITAISKHLRAVIFKFELDLDLPPVDWEMLEKHRSELHIPRYAHNRTHWAVKNVELMEVLQPILDLASIQGTAPLDSPVHNKAPGPLGTSQGYRMSTAPASTIDVAIVTVIQPELFAALDALRISPSTREKTEQGTVYFRGSLHSHLMERDYQVIVTCIGVAGNYDASAAASEVIATHRPRFLLLMGIAAGIRGKVRIGDAVLSERVVAYEPASVVASHDGHSPNTEHRPEIEKIPHAVNQDVITYRPEPARLDAGFRSIGGKYPTVPVGKSEEFQRHVASAIAVRTATLASTKRPTRPLRDRLEVPPEGECRGKRGGGALRARGSGSAGR